MDERVIKALLNNDFQGLRAKDVFRFLYSDREILRFKAAEALGSLCRGNSAYNYLLRFFWHLSDESGAYCVGAPLAIAEIAFRNLEVFEGFKMKFLYLLENEEVERSYVAYGILRNARIYDFFEARDLLRKKILELNDLRFKAYAILALRKMGEKVAVPDLRARIQLYNGKEIAEIEFNRLLEVQHL